MNNYKLSIILSLLLLLLSGCWDSINIEERGFIVGSAIDLEEMKEDKPIYSITDQLVPSTSFGNTAQGESDEPYLNLTMDGSSIYRIEEELAAISSKTPYYEHLKIIAISEEVAKTDSLMKQLIDRYIRDVSLRRGVHVVITKDQASDLLDVDNPENKLPSIHIHQMLKQNSEDAGFLTPLRLGEIEELHLRKRSYVLPLMSTNGETIGRKAGAVFQGPKGKMVGNFNEKEMLGLELYKEDANENVIEFTYHDHVFAFKIEQVKSKQKIDTSKQPNIKVNSNISLYGTIKEAPIDEDITSTETIKAMQEAIEKEAEKTVEAIIEKSQKELHADVFNLWQKLQTKHYSTWKEIRDDWEEGEDYFANNVTFDIDVEADIYSVGTSKKTR